MKRISLQIKIIAITVFLIAIPIIFMNVIYLKHKNIEKSRMVISRISEQWKKLSSKTNEEISREELAKMDPESEEFINYIKSAKSSDEGEEGEEGEGDSEEKENGGEEGEDGEEEDEGEEGEEDEDEDGNAKKAKVKAASVPDKPSENAEEAKEEEKEEEKEDPYSKENLIKLKNEKLAEMDTLIELKDKEIKDFQEFLERSTEGEQNVVLLDKLDKSLSSLVSYLMYFYYFSWWFIVFVCVFMVFYINHEASPFKKITENLKSFQNEKEKVPGDIVECALKFDNFLTTAKTLLQESYSISQEIGKKLEPLTVVSVFSDDNVKQFFTDVQEISRSSNYIANTLDSTTAHIQEVSASAQTIADRSHEAATDSAETAAIAGEGKNAVSETIDTMESIKDEVLGLEDVIENLNSASKQIGEIVNTITGIAYQTNLLALNAAIEAARAGEHGQGFTVVANEVKKLAEESGEAAEDISKKIKEMLKKTGMAVETINRGATKVIEGVNIANLAGNNLDKIVTSVSNVNKMIQDISNASTEQSQNIDSLRGSIESITGATKITSEGTKRVASAVNEQLAHIRQYINVTKELLTLVQMMGEMLDKFDYN